MTKNYKMITLLGKRYRWDINRFMLTLLQLFAIVSWFYLFAQVIKADFEVFCG